MLVYLLTLIVAELIYAGYFFHLS